MNAHKLPFSSKYYMKTPPVSPDLDEGARRDVIAGLIESIGESRDREAFRELFKSFAPKIKSYAIKQGLLENCDELVQEVMVNIWRRAKQFDHKKASGSTWIFAITRNARIDLLRKLGRTQYETPMETEQLWSLPGGDDPVSSFQKASLARNLRDSLTCLPNEQRDVIAKVYLEDKSHQRVADELDLPLGTVKSRVRLALQKLRIILQEESV